MALKVLLTVNPAWLDQPLFLVVAGREKLPVIVEEIDIPSGSGAPGGPFASVQFNNGGTFGGDDRFVYAPGTGQPAVFAALAGDEPGYFVVDESNVSAGAFRRSAGAVEIVATAYPLKLRTEDDVTGSDDAYLTTGAAAGGTAGTVFGRAGNGQNGGAGIYGGGDGTSAGGDGIYQGGDSSGATGSKLIEFGAIGANGGGAAQEIGTGGSSNGFYSMRYRGGSDFLQVNGPAIPPGARGVSLKRLTGADQLFYLFENNASPTPLGYLAWLGSTMDLNSGSAPLRFVVNGNAATWPAANAAGVLTNNGAGVLSWGASVTETLQQTYAASTPATITTAAPNGPVQIQNTAVPGAPALACLSTQPGSAFTSSQTANGGSAIAGTVNTGSGMAAATLTADGANNVAARLQATSGAAPLLATVGANNALQVRSDARSEFGAAGSSYVLPLARGTAGQVLTTNGVGDVSWQTPAGATVPLTVAARLATTGNQALTGLAAIDGVVPVAGDRIFVRANTTASENGIYIAAAGAWSRATDYDSDAEIRNTLVNIADGTAGANTLWSNTNLTAITVGVTAITFAVSTIATAAGSAVNGAAGTVGTSNRQARENHTHQVTGGSFSGTALTFGATTDGQVLTRSGTSIVSTQPGLGTPSLGAVVTSVNTTALPSSAAYTQLMNLAISPPTAGTYLIEGMIPIRSETAYGETFDVQLACTGATTFTTKVATKGGYFFASAGSPNNYEDQIYFRLSVALNAGANNIGIQIRQQNAGGTARTINPQAFQYSAAAQRQ